MRLDAVKQYILHQDYPEVFGDANYKTRIESFVDVDVDNDGSKEFVVLYHPHYRQSPTIILYKIGPEMKVSRVPEGLAPGPLQPVSGDYLDSHSVGMGVDFSVQGGVVPEKLVELVKNSGMSGLAIYDNFTHMDGRKGSLSIVDMRGVAVPGKKNTCENFEFSTVRQIAVGHLHEDATQNYLAAWVGDQIYVYLIHGITPLGMLNKKLTVVKAPTGFNGFIDSLSLAYKTSAGTEVLTLH